MNDKRISRSRRLYTQYTAGRKESLKNIYGKSLSGRLSDRTFWPRNLGGPTYSGQEEFKKS